MRIFKHLFKTAGKDLTKGSLELVANLAPEMMTEANRSMIEEALKKARISVATLTKAYNKDLKETAVEKSKMDASKGVVLKIGAQLEAVEDKTSEKAIQLRNQALEVRAEYDAHEIEYNRELQEDAQAKAMLDEAIKVMEAYEKKINEYDALAKNAKDRKKMLEMKREHLNLKKQNEDAINNLNSMTIGLDVMAKNAEKDEIELMAMEMELDANGSGNTVSATEAFLQEEAATAAAGKDPFAF